MLIHKVNSDAALKDSLAAGRTAHATAPVMATPALLAATPAVAKGVGVAVGAGAVTGAAYVAYKTAGG